MQYGEHDWRVGPVSLDGVGQVIAEFDYNYRWNGWLNPLLDAYSVVKVLEEINASYGEDDVKWYGYDWEWLDDGLYPLGTYEWTWSEDSDYGATEEWVTWVEELRNVHCAANNESNRKLIAAGVKDRFTLNDEAAAKASDEYCRQHPEPPKFPNGAETWQHVPGTKIAG
jgi:hypothetical protein